jgi:hypothetical protein
MVRGVDESGEDYLYPRTFFAEIRYPHLAKTLASATSRRDHGKGDCSSYGVTSLSMTWIATRSLMRPDPRGVAALLVIGVLHQST